MSLLYIHNYLVSNVAMIVTLNIFFFWLPSNSVMSPLYNREVRKGRVKPNKSLLPSILSIIVLSCHWQSLHFSYVAPSSHEELGVCMSLAGPCMGRGVPDKLWVGKSWVHPVDRFEPPETDVIPHAFEGWPVQLSGDKYVTDQLTNSFLPKS